MRKKIIISSYDDVRNPHYGGGGARAVHEISKRLRANYDISVVSWNHSGVVSEEIDGVSYNRVGFEYINPKVAMLVFQIMILLAALFRKYDLWIESTTPPFSFSLLPLVARSKVFSWINMLSAGDMRRKYKLPFWFVEKALSRSYKYFLVTSGWAKDVIEKEYGNNDASFGLLPNGIAALPTINKRIGNYILYLGRLEINQKGLDLLLAAFAKLDKRITTKLVIAGNGSNKEASELKRLIRNNKLENKVLMIGRVEGAKKARLFSECLAFVLPSRFDTYPLVILEAFSYSKPVVLFNLPQLAWVPSRASVKVKCFDTDEYAQALTRFINNKAERQAIGEAGYQFAKGNTWDEIAKRLISYIEKNI